MFVTKSHFYKHTKRKQSESFPLFNTWLNEIVLAEACRNKLMNEILP